MKHLHPAVPVEVQRRTLAAIDDRVRVAALAGVNPVVEVDLDLTSLMPDERTETALLALAHAHQIPELFRLAAFPMLPGYTAEAWADFLELTGLGARYSALRKLRSLDTEVFWDEATLHTDRVTPGFKSFIKRVEALGGVVVLSSHRWHRCAEEATHRAFATGGLASLALLVGEPELSDAENRRRHQVEIRARYGRVVAVIDDEKTHRDVALAAAWPGAVGVAVALPMYSAARETAQCPLRISTFEP
ncbi:MAG: hypothetical protein IPJ65_13965 [Archangiaceae bacterium]|nr:hypothetical protein [Archangiaceae bacterium]